MTTYGILFQGIYIKYYSYVKIANVKALSKYLNDKVKKYGEEVLGVYVTDDMESNRGDSILFPSEYQNQRFFETYEERLLEQHRVDQLVV